MIRDVPLTIQGCPLSLELYVLSFQGDDVTGVSWLATLGPVVKDYSRHRFEFTLAGTRYIWNGEPPLEVQPVQLQSLRRLPLWMQ